MTLGTDRRGLRATRDGGEWEFYKDANGQAVVLTEIRTLVNERTPLEQKMLKAEISQKLKSAERGELRFGEKDDVAAIRRKPDLCELRLGYAAFDKAAGSRFKYRLYFVEPAQRQMLLLGLKFAKKPATHAGLAEQDKHIDCANDRYVKGLSYLWGLNYPKK